MKKIDLTGQRFGKLVVIKEGKHHVQKSGKKITTWDCICDCGGHINVLTNSLRNGNTQSCGCLKKEAGKKIGDKYKYILEKRALNLEGERFGRLIVIVKTADRKQGSIVYLCKCDCGKKQMVTEKHLKDGSIKSCGCLLKETASERAKELELNMATYYKNTRICCLSDTIFKNNQTGVKGCYFDKSKNKYVVRIGIQGKTHYIGSFDKIEDARKARQTAEDELWQPLIDEYNENEVRY